VAIVRCCNTELTESSNRHTFHRLKVQTRPYTLVVPPRSHRSLRDITLRRRQGFRPRPRLRRRRCPGIIVTRRNMVDRNTVLATVKGKS